jgi:hypothetical protein
VQRLSFTAAACAALLLWPTQPAAGKPPHSWDGLVQVPSKRLELVYLQPGADFRSYTKVMLDPTEVAFHKNWRRDYNRNSRDLAGKVSDGDIERAVSEGITAASAIFEKAWAKGGYPVVTEPGPDVLRVRTAILNITVSAPDMRSPGRSYSFSDTGGSAQLVIEVRDSMTNALLGRAVDGQVAGDSTVGWRSSVSNRSDFRDLAEQWARQSVAGMTLLKAMKPIGE